MTDTIAVLNAGSSSLKFSLFGVGDTLSLVVRGQVEGIGTAPRFVAKDPSGAVVAEQSWGGSDAIDHAGAVEHLFSYLATDLRRGKLLAVGHRDLAGR